MDIILNGQSHSLEPDSSVEQLMEELETNLPGRAVAINRTVVPRAEWAKTLICEGDRVEIVQAVGGG